jgi:hypothetical protein
MHMHGEKQRVKLKVLSNARGLLCLNGWYNNGKESPFFLSVRYQYDCFPPKVCGPVKLNGRGDVKQYY